MTRRSKEDTRWQELKEIIKRRDKTDRFIRCLTLKELELYKKTIKVNKIPKSMLSTLDVAHIFPVSIYPELCYDTFNVVLINRYAHHCLDNNIDPLTYTIISQDEVFNWWKKIAGEQMFKQCEDKIRNIRTN